MSGILSRREFLKLSWLGAMAGLGRQVWQVEWDSVPPGDPTRPKLPSIRMGRTARSMKYFLEPAFDSKELGFYNSSQVLGFNAEILGPGSPDLNPLWLKTKDGWVNAAFIQPVKNILNTPVADIPAGGFLAEVSVPVTQAWKIKMDRMVRAYRFFYGTTHWVDHHFSDDYGNNWYRVYDDREKIYYYAVAEHYRPIQAEELTPISPNVYNKRIEVYLDTQRLVAFEGEVPVFNAFVSTGSVRTDTPVGDFVVERKRPSRHMAVEEGNGFDLPAVPWVSYIAWTGVSFHGTYWHNNFGHPMSHGCINLSIDNAKWIYRWTLPYVPADDVTVEADGTQVVVLDQDPLES